MAAAREAAAADFDVLIACKARMNSDLHMAGDLKNTGKGHRYPMHHNYGKCCLYRRGDSERTKPMEEIQRVFLMHLPRDAWRMGRRITKGAKHPNKEGRKTTRFAPAAEAVGAGAHGGEAAT